MKSSTTLDLDVVVDWYRKWTLSEPFDFEYTLSDTIRKLKEEDANIITIKEAAIAKY